MKDSGWISGDLAQEVSEEKAIDRWPRDCSCNILVKNGVSFCPCPKIIMPEAKLRICSFDRRVFKKLSNDCVSWLLVATLEQNYL